VRITVEREPPLIKTLMMRSINAVLEFSALSEDSVVNATAAPTNLTVLVRALSSKELLDDLRAAEPLAPAFIRGIEPSVDSWKAGHILLSRSARALALRAKLLKNAAARKN
jgi:hypothetical protein